MVLIGGASTFCNGDVRVDSLVAVVSAGRILAACLVGAAALDVVGVRETSGRSSPLVKNLVGWLGLLGGDALFHSDSALGALVRLDCAFTVLVRLPGRVYLVEPGDGA